jgi:hypothetical protein
MSVEEQDSPASHARRPNRIVAASLAGFVAIALNTLALKAADLVPLATARGGLLRLITLWLSDPLEHLGIPRLWAIVGGPAPSAPAFQIGFHTLVGLLMAMFYALLLESLPPKRAWTKGLLYATGVWILNAAVILPATGEGFAGRDHLTITGMIWFAAAHTLFFIVLASSYSELRRSSPGIIDVRRRFRRSPKITEIDCLG